MANRTKATEQLCEFAQSKKVSFKADWRASILDRQFVTVLSFNNYSVILCHVHCPKFFFLVLIANESLYVV